MFDQREVFEGRAQPGEFYVFQIGVFAARKRIDDLRLRFSDLVSPQSRRISADAFRCFNLNGVDWLGSPRRYRFRLARGKVRALWIGVQVPKDTAGTYHGRIEVQPKGLPPSVVKLRLHVSGPVLNDCGDSEAWRLSRLRWLDSTRGLEQTLVPPFTPVRVRGNVVSILNRKITFGELGLPTSIRSNRVEVLARPMEFVVELASKTRLRWLATEDRLVRATQCEVVRLTKASSEECTLTVRSKTEFDGCITFCATLEARRDVKLADIRLEIPIRREVATYMMGMGKRGGIRPKEWHWKWSLRADNMVWIGEVGRACN